MMPLLLHLSDIRCKYFMYQRCNSPLDTPLFASCKQWRSEGGGGGCHGVANGRKIVFKNYTHANSDCINLFAYEEQKKYYR